MAFARCSLLALLLALPAPAQPPDYSRLLKDELRRLGPMTVQAFQAAYPQDGLDRIRWDPTTATFWPELNLAPPPVREGQMARPDFRLNPEETRIFHEQGFVVSERLGRDSMTGLLYRIYSADLPVFVSADCILHAWHQSFEETFASLEGAYLSKQLEAGLGDLWEQLPAAAADYDSGPLASSLRDADLILTVGLTLVKGKPVASQLGQEQRVGEVLALCAAQSSTKGGLFGYPRLVDFSRMKVRGRYERLPRLQNYFRASVWCQLACLRLTDDDNADRELGTALILADLLRRSGQGNRWSNFEKTIEQLVGRPDGLSLGQARAWLGERKVTSLPELRQELLNSRLGVEQIPSYRESSPAAAAPLPNPRVFFLTGGRFTIDSWAFAQTTFAQVEWNGARVQRRLPSGLDVAFGVLGNDAVVPTLVRRMQGPGMALRDGLNYQHNLAAVRGVIDALPPEEWDASISSQWLATLRELSSPPEPGTPEAMRTRAWAQRLANTQLASWAQLRHDIIMDSKQSETGGTLCSYPHGLVEPRPAFWGRLQAMALAMSRVGTGQPSGFYQNFARCAGILRGISEKQLASQPLDESETIFLRDMLEIGGHRSGGGHFTGWYFTLFTRAEGRDDPERWEPTVADVHTAHPDPVSGDPGGVLLEGTGAADLLILAADHGPDRRIYLGPTLSHYEWKSQERLTDSQWRFTVESGLAPPRPEWTEPYLVPLEW